MAAGRRSLTAFKRPFKGLYKAFKRPFEGKCEQWQQARSLKGLSNAF